ncbi:D-2-hydroxyacid dehydrogenase [Weissella diestrammenae]|uniref:D-2-hydroxyacid dehydrogenase n=1 Tax=Weissella diestrammenae TaxID=1162633 RepID=A0A7G9T747_9LACO|nr:NAD(P)-dependent oxidoreductase [Weissella diestrammenae]MCM0582478.1 D-2-hydroxyacid dehydrogenase [Weissella diestrammenae]QNN75922.1 D-2-hydroxyacid dehydrogenase [Weissella diestrammenae]
MKLHLYSVQAHEEKALDAYQAQHPELELVRIDTELHPDTLVDLDGVDGILIQQRTPIGGDQTFYDTLSVQGIKQITTRTAGYDMIEVDRAKNAGLSISNVPAYSPRSVAEFALMQIFRLLRHTPAFDTRVAKQNFLWAGLAAREIHSVTVGIIGAGRIGGTLAGLLHALGARVLVYDVRPRVEVSYVADYVDIQTLLKQSDVISIHVDLNSTSIDLINRDAFAEMKTGMMLVNASRGPVVNTEALFEALDNGQVAAAALDTMPNEGPIFNADFTNGAIPDINIAKAQAHPNILLTPHIAFFTDTAIDNMTQIALDDAIKIIKTGQSEHTV